VYGYDLVTALTNVAKATPSQKLAELFNGLASTIHTGGELKGFLDKRSETLLQDYKLEREKFTKVAETFMDIYISVVIAMPMILMLVLVIMSVSGINIGLSPMTMAVGIVFLIAVVNFIFMGVLQAKQPAY
jgi:flagellar protein FlaJ